MAAIMERADENLLPAVYKEVSEAFTAGPSDSGYLTFTRPLFIYGNCFAQWQSFIADSYKDEVRGTGFGFLNFNWYTVGGIGGGAIATVMAGHEFWGIPGWRFAFGHDGNFEFDHNSAAALVGLFAAGCALGSFFGGVVADRMSRIYPHSGRVMCAQFSSFMGILLMVPSSIIPPASQQLFHICCDFIHTGLTISWCNCYKWSHVSEVVRLQSTAP
ncbi:hypothetical protein HAX54_048379 [Datura stramonium]|uniref:Major facilitator superfamily (MFS) profile domain-containing protein n=1 Tax=Datura stramonium TaxID=4076 RepID=A0ABS8SUI1_DATST|nr:hypothetical protein [Datura stramonium]